MCLGRSTNGTKSKHMKRKGKWQRKTGGGYSVVREEIMIVEQEKNEILSDYNDIKCFYTILYKPYINLK